jgi:hypothetical protein
LGSLTFSPVLLISVSVNPELASVIVAPGAKALKTAAVKQMMVRRTNPLAEPYEANLGLMFEGSPAVTVEPVSG